MSQHDREEAARPDILQVRKTFQFGRLVIGMQFDPAESFAPESGELDDLGIVQSTATQSSNGISRHNPSQSPFTRFTAQRPVIYSGSHSGFFEHEEAQAVLTRFGGVAKSSTVPHAAIMERSFAKQIIANRPNVSLQAIVSECRQVADKLPDRQYGHVHEAIARGSVILLRLDRVAGQRLAQDIGRLCKHFGVPFDNDQKAFFPHVTVARAPDSETANQIAEQLNPVINPSKGPKANAIGFGGVTVLQG